MSPLLSRLGNNGGSLAGFGFGRKSSGPSIIIATISPGPGAGVPSGSFTFDGSVLKLTTSGDYTLTFDKPGSINVFAWGAGGAAGQQPGGSGSKVQSVLNVVSGQNYLFTIGGAGTFSATLGNGGGFNGGGGGGGTGGNPAAYGAGGGGGYSGVFYGPPKSQPAAMLIAGGGGGGAAMAPTAGGSGGYPSGGTPRGGTQLAGGPGANPGTALQGGTGGGSGGFFQGGGGGGGGGGYYGGGGGPGAVVGNDANGGGGGSSYGNPTYTTNFTATTPNSGTTSTEPSTYYTPGKGNTDNPGMIAVY